MVAAVGAADQAAVAATTGSGELPVMTPSDVKGRRLQSQYWTGAACVHCAGILNIRTWSTYGELVCASHAALRNW